MRALLVTLRSGEAEFDRCVASVRAQTGIEVEHVVFSDLPNVEAHRRCYETIEDRRSEYDIAVKLDADMVLRGTSSLGAMAEVFRDDGDLDHAQFALDDFYTGRLIMGVQSFSPRVRWPTTEEGLFVDPAPVVPGHRRLVWGPPAPVAVHSPDPSPIQAFRFGVHRAQKAFQPGRDRVRGSQARDQWRMLMATWQNFVRTSDVRLGLAAYGADLVWRGEIDISTSGYRSSIVDEAFDAAPQDAESLRRLMASRWDNRIRRTAARCAALGPRGTARLAAAVLLDRRPGDERAHGH